jgi:hypothetical protein
MKISASSPQSLEIFSKFFLSIRFPVLRKYANSIGCGGGQHRFRQRHLSAQVKSFGYLECDQFLAFYEYMDASVICWSSTIEFEAAF